MYKFNQHMSSYEVPLKQGSPMFEVRCFMLLRTVALCTSVFTPRLSEYIRKMSASSRQAKEVFKAYFVPDGISGLYH